MERDSSITVLGLAAYPPGRLWPEVADLVLSARRNARLAQVFLVTSHVSERDAELLEKCHTRWLPLVPPIPSFDGDEQATASARQGWVRHLYAQRHSFYLAALRQITTPRVLLSDTRDVLITGDLSAQAGSQRLLLSQEDATKTIADDTWNTEWVLGAYGAEGMARLGTRAILCAGSVLGPHPAIHAYLEKMASELARLGPEVTRRVGDQPIHNHLAHSGALGPFDVSPAEDGPIRSIGNMALERISIDWAEHSGARPAVIHQFDRHLCSRRVKHAVLTATGRSLAGHYARAALRRLGVTFR